MDRGRFSLLLLDPGEIYFEDYSVFFIKPNITPKTYDLKKQDGRLKMCSKSLVFDPKDITKPVMKIPLKDCQIIEKYKGTAKFVDNNNVLYVKCSHYYEMLKGNIIAPYKWCESASFLFLLKYGNIEDCRSQICQLQRANTLPAIEQSNMISAIVRSRYSRITFDPFWMELYEDIILETQASQITPLVVNPGRIVLSNSRLYFQPYNNIAAYPVLKIDLSNIRRIVKRRFLLKHIGLEIFTDESVSSHIYLTLNNERERDNLYKKLLEQPKLQIKNFDQDIMTLQWQNGIISNYEYLLYLNSLGDRSVNDLTQYPVFPWIISDYTSETIDLNDSNVYRDLTKPIGALNDERLTKLMERFDEMPEPKYIYGSHYSTPAFVLFYLVRLYPNYMLCLQNGRFDHPDRMFNSITDVYRNCMINMTDFKELIPEFYNVDDCGKFLMNNLGIDFGYRHNGVKVGDVELPTWADDQKHFVKTLRDALESDITSKDLHHWIDLIFGYKQTGEEALKSNNLFYHLCYEGNVDLDSINDINLKHTHEIQIMEFGQIPKQVFKVPHPQRKIGIVLLKEPTLVAEDIQLIKPMENVWINAKQLQLYTTFTTHKDTVSSLLVTDDSNVISVGHDSKLKVFSLMHNRQIRNANIGKMPLSSVLQLPKTNIIIAGSYDNSIVLYDMEFGRISQNVMAHEDAITCTLWSKKLNVLCTGSADSTVRLWKGFDGDGKIKPVQCLICQLDHNSPITSMCIDTDDKCLAVGTEDGEIYVWDLELNKLTKKLYGHNKSVTGINYSPDKQKIASCGKDKIFQVIDVNTSLSLYNKLMNESLTSLNWHDTLLLLIGSNDGMLYVWNIEEVKILYEIKAHDAAITVIAISNKENVIVTGSEDNLVKVWKPT